MADPIPILERLVHTRRDFLVFLQRLITPAENARRIGSADEEPPSQPDTVRQRIRHPTTHHGNPIGIYRTLNFLNSLQKLWVMGAGKAGLDSQRGLQVPSADHDRVN